MTEEELAQLADAWLAYWHAPEKTPTRSALFWATDYERELCRSQPEELWRLILLLHQRDQSVAIMQVLSAGPLEDLLAKHGDTFIDRVEDQAARDPAFACLLGGVWNNAMSDSVWKRLQVVRDRRGWDGSPTQ
jgi:hypothetical protein